MSFADEDISGEHWLCTNYGDLLTDSICLGILEPSQWLKGSAILTSHTHTQKKFCEDQREGLDPSDTEASVHGQNSNLPHLTPWVQPWDSTIPRLLPSEEKATAAMSRCHGSEEREGGHSSFQPTSCYLIATWANDLNPPNFCVAIRKMGMLCVLTNEMEIIRPSFCGWKLWIRELIPLVTYWQLSVSSPKEHSVN